MTHFAVVGAGFSGAVAARELAEAGHDVDVFDVRDHVAGNCHTRRHETGVLVHVYGPHIFHTPHQRVWDYVRRFATMRPYRHRVRAIVRDRAYQMPMNLGLINSFFGTSMTPEQAERYVAGKADATIVDPAQHDVGVRALGVEMVDRDPVELGPQVLLDLRHQPPDIRLEVGIVGAVFRRDDEAELVAVMGAALEQLRALPFDDLGFAKVDHHRAIRTGFPEVIFGSGKTAEQIIEITRSLSDGLHNVLITRLDPEPAARDNPLIGLDSVVAVPHMAAYTHEGRRRSHVAAAERDPRRQQDRQRAEVTIHRREGPAPR